MILLYVIIGAVLSYIGVSSGKGSLPPLLVRCNHCSPSKLGEHHLPFWTGKHSNSVQSCPKLCLGAKHVSRKLQHPWNRSSCKLLHGCWFRNQVIRSSSIYFLESLEKLLLDFDKLPGTRLLPLPEKWFTIACHLCGIFAGGLAGVL